MSETEAISAFEMEQGSRSAAFPPNEERVAASAKLAADLARLPMGTPLRLTLGSGSVHVGLKIDCGANGIKLGGYSYSRFEDVTSFEVADSLSAFVISRRPASVGR